MGEVFNTILSVLLIVWVVGYFGYQARLIYLLAARRLNLPAEAGGIFLGQLYTQCYPVNIVEPSRYRASLVNQ